MNRKRLHDHIGPVPLALLALLLASSIAHAANPTSVKTTLYYRIAGVNYSEPLLDADIYRTTDTPFDAGKVTSAGNKIEYVVVTYAFEYTDSGGRTVNTGHVDAFWDNYYAGYTKKSANTTAKNCYGYAMPHPFWVNDAAVILADEYTADNTLDADVKKIGDHMIKLDELVKPGAKVCLKKKSEKNRDSGVYELDSVAPAYQGELTGAHKRN
ncbi:MAG: hypothetical protein KGY81_10500 [Phycisphaerae bacterium]|jgi:hypothetical protein|nr:hypothetical protein [Phycisphaerae bacterium]